MYKLVVDQTPNIKWSIQIRQCLEYTLHISGIEIQVSSLPSEHPTKIVSMDNVYSLVKDMEASQCPITEKEKPTIKSILSDLETLTVDFQDEPKLSFIKEQLFLLIKSVNGRRYSPNLMGLAVMWHECSSALYKQIKSDNVITLPSERRIRQLTNALTVTYDLSDSTVRYIQARKDKLSQKDSYITLIGDEV